MNSGGGSGGGVGLRSCGVQDEGRGYGELRSKSDKNKGRGYQLPLMRLCSKVDVTSHTGDGICTMEMPKKDEV